MKLLVLLLLFPQILWAQFVHESEISLLGTGGNTDVQTYNFRTKNQWDRRQNTYRFGGHYTYGESGEAVNVRDWDANLHYERKVSTNAGLFIGEVVEGFRFRNIKARYNSDIGYKYHFIRSDLQNFFSEVGYRYTIEDRYAPQENLYESKGRLYTEYNRKVTETFTGRLWVEYVPNFTDDREYLLNFEASGTAILTSVFSLRVAFRGFYDDRPANPNLRNFDYQYTTSLVSKF
jgi:putative salt-induced outer membrane protein